MSKAPFRLVPVFSIVIAKVTVSPASTSRTLLLTGRDLRPAEVTVPVQRGAEPGARNVTPAGPRLAGAKMLEAKSASAVVRAALSAAAGICAAPSAIWWQRADGRFSVKHLHGKIASPKPLLLGDSSLDCAAGNTAFALPARPGDGSALLVHLKAKRMAVIPIRDGRRWFGLLTVQDAVDYIEEHLE